MIIKQTKVNQIEITQNNDVQVRISLELLEDGAQISNAWHRTVFPVGCDIDAQFDAVNQHLIQMNKEPVSIADIDRVKLFCSVAWKV